MKNTKQRKRNTVKRNTAQMPRIRRKEGIKQGKVQN